MREIKIVKGSYPDLGDAFGKLHDFDINQLPVTALSNSDGSPMVDLWLEGGIGYLQGQTLREASKAASLTIVGSGNIMGGSIAGETALRLTSVRLNALDYPAYLDSFSAFFVVQNKSTSTDNRYLMGSSNGTTHGALTTILTTTGFSTYVGRSGTAIQLIAPGNFLDETPRLCAVTFSTENGVTLRVNGNQVASDRSRNQKISDPSANLILFGGPSSAGLWNGEVGNVLFTSGHDLSQNIFALDTIERFLMNKYQIS